ncbi:MAG: hypothetical protein Q8922_05245 [Bacteroidota bacterium]|nr:hypothetical protein [Bacteroidota bacterium]MDP4231894.1 hypothetical protein [Bacteroidota bacterium]MDP4241399.1 hypothetical protein [Bacteroidota bacterium]MDP4287322.1 hypothetical protein [Bacteroidota bacterium]
MIHRSFLFVAIGCSLLGGILFGGCTPACDIVPTQSLAHLRIIDAVADVPEVTIRIDNSKVFDHAYYNLDRYTAPFHPLGYISQYLDGSGLSAGPHRITVYEGHDTLGRVILDTSLTLTEQDETLTCAGLQADLANARPRIIQLYDEWPFDGTGPSRLRFVQAVPDLIKGIDVYFLDSGKGPRIDTTNHVDTLKPDIRLAFGEVTDGQGGGRGTGKSFSDYVVLGYAPNTLITIAKDTSASGIIVRVPYPLSTSGLFSTILIRGRGQPVDTQANIALVDFRDGSKFGGSTSIDYRLYGVRFLNATRIDSLSLLVHQPGAIKAEPDPRDNLPQQQVVFDIKPNAISEYWRLTTTFDWDPIFTIAKSHHQTGADSVFNLQFATEDNARYTLIAEETTPLGSPNSVISVLRLNDTLDIPANANQCRARFINASPDHATITVTDSTTGALIASLGAEGTVVTKDIPISNHTIKVSDGTNSKNIPLNLTNDSPISIIFTAASTSDSFPYAIATK